MWKPTEFDIFVTGDWTLFNDGFVMSFRVLISSRYLLTQVTILPKDLYLLIYSSSSSLKLINLYLLLLVLCMLVWIYAICIDVWHCLLVISLFKKIYSKYVYLSSWSINKYKYGLNSQVYGSLILSKEWFPL